MRMVSKQYRNCIVGSGALLPLSSSRYMPSRSTLALAFGGAAAAIAVLYALRQQKKNKKVLVVGSINVDLYQRTKGGAVTFAKKQVSILPIKGMTLPATSFLANPKIEAKAAPGEEEAFVLTMDGPFEQKTGGKGANAAAAAAQTFACDFVGNMGEASAKENKALLRDLAAFGQVGTQYLETLQGKPTGTAYILLFDDNDNAILLLGGANQAWPPEHDLCAVGGRLHTAVSGAAAVMLQREVPEYVNVATAKLARSLGTPVVMDVGGTDAPLDPNLMPYVTVIAPNESELTFISGVETQDKATGAVQGPLLRKAVAALRSKFAAAGNGSVEVLVTLGAMGSMHFGADGSETSMGRFKLSTADGKPRDTCGAGDCYRGSFVGARYGEGKSISDAMRWAAAASACSVEVEGAMPSMPPRAKIEERCRQEMLPFAGL